MSLLEIRDLRVSFVGERGESVAVDGINLTLAPGARLGLVGESGSGKSVSALAILGLLDGSARISGSIRLNGVELVGAPESTLRAIRGKEIGMIFQEPLSALNPVLTIGEQIAEGIRAHARVDWPEAHRRSIAALAEVEIADPERIARCYPRALSGGMRQRAMIAMMLALEPRVLIADEPTTALDTTIQAGILDLIVRLTKERQTALILITHDLGVVAEVAETIAVMYAGQIVETGPVRTVLTSPASPYARALIDSIPSAASHGRELPVIAGSPPASGEFPPGCRFHPRCPVAVARCSTEMPQLLAVSAEHMARCLLLEEKS